MYPMTGREVVEQTKADQAWVVRMVRKISRQAPAYRQEWEFFHRLRALWPEDHYWQSGHLVGPDDVEDQELAQLMPHSLWYRRGPRQMVKHQLPVDSVTLLGAKEYAVRGLGLEAREALGPRLEQMRRDAWITWTKLVELAGEDPDANNGDTAIISRLLRLGKLGAPREWRVTDCTAFLARSLFPDELAGLGGHEAVDEIVRWALAAAPLRHGAANAIQRQVTAIFNAILQPVRPTTGMVAMVRQVFFRGVNGWKDRRVRLSRQAAIRLLCRLRAQLETWEHDTVTAPTRWFTEKKDPTDPRSIVGVSTANYMDALIDPLTKASVLTELERGHPARHQSTTYRLALGVQDDGAAMTLAEAEIAVKRL